MAWHIWLIIAIVCFIIETFTVEFTFLMLGGAALVATGVAFGTESLVWQIIAFSIASVALILFARPWAKNRMNPKGPAAGNVYGQVGKPGKAVTQIDEGAGRVKIGGDVWSARSTGGMINEGTDVVVVAIDGATAVVAPRPQA